MAVGRTLGWQLLKSTLFDVERTATGYRFRGSGRGHGVGLCVRRIGAAGRVGTIRAGDPGALLSRDRDSACDARARAADQTAIEIAVPAGEERERAARRRD